MSSKKDGQTTMYALLKFERIVICAESGSLLTKLTQLILKYLPVTCVEEYPKIHLMHNQW